MKKIALLLALLVTTGCVNDSDVVSRNISKSADQFEVTRRIVFYNGINGEYMLTIEGLCALEVTDKKLAVVCKTSTTEYKKHYLGLSDNVTYFAEQIDSIRASPYHYRVVFKPSVIVPNVEIR